MEEDFLRVNSTLSEAEVAQNAFLSPSALAARRLGKRAITPSARRPGLSQDESFENRSQKSHRTADNAQTFDHVSSTTKVNVSKSRSTTPVKMVSTPLQDFFSEASSAVLETFSPKNDHATEPELADESAIDTVPDSDVDCSYFSAGGSMAISTPGKVDERVLSEDLDESNVYSDIDRDETEDEDDEEDNEILALERQLEMLKREKEMAQLEDEIARLKKSTSDQQSETDAADDAVDAVDVEHAKVTPSVFFGRSPITKGFVPPHEQPLKEETKTSTSCTDYMFCFAGGVPPVGSGDEILSEAVMSDTVLSEAVMSDGLSIPAMDSQKDTLSDTLNLENIDTEKSFCPTIAEGENEDESTTIKDDVTTIKDDLESKAGTIASAEDDPHVRPITTLKSGITTFRSGLDGVDEKEEETIPVESKEPPKGSISSSFFCWGRQYTPEEQEVQREISFTGSAIEKLRQSVDEHDMAKSKSFVAAKDVASNEEPVEKVQDNMDVDESNSKTDEEVVSKPSAGGNDGDDATRVSDAPIEPTASKTSQGALVIEEDSSIKDVSKAQGSYLQPAGQTSSFFCFVGGTYVEEPVVVVPDDAGFPTSSNAASIVEQKADGDVGTAVDTLGPAASSTSVNGQSAQISILDQTSFEQPMAPSMSMGEEEIDGVQEPVESNKATTTLVSESKTTDSVDVKANTGDDNDDTIVVNDSLTEDKEAPPKTAESSARSSPLTRFLCFAGAEETTEGMTDAEETGQKDQETAATQVDKATTTLVSESKTTDSVDVKANTGDDNDDTIVVNDSLTEDKEAPPKTAESSARSSPLARFLCFAGAEETTEGMTDVDETGQKDQEFAATLVDKADDNVTADEPMEIKTKNEENVTTESAAVVESEAMVEEDTISDAVASPVEEKPTPEQLAKTAAASSFSTFMFFGGAEEAPEEKKSNTAEEMEGVEETDDNAVPEAEEDTDAAGASLEEDTIIDPEKTNAEDNKPTQEEILKAAARSSLSRFLCYAGAEEDEADADAMGVEETSDEVMEGGCHKDEEASAEMEGDDGVNPDAVEKARGDIKDAIDRTPEKAPAGIKDAVERARSGIEGDVAQAEGQEENTRSTDAIVSTDRTESPHTKNESSEVAKLDEGKAKITAEEKPETDVRTSKLGDRPEEVEDMIPLIDLDPTEIEEDEVDNPVVNVAPRKKKVNLGPWDLLCGDFVQESTVTERKTPTKSRKTAVAQEKSQSTNAKSVQEQETVTERKTPTKSRKTAVAQEKSQSTNAKYVQDKSANNDKPTKSIIDKSELQSDMQKNYYPEEEKKESEEVADVVSVHGDEEEEKKMDAMKFIMSVSEKVAKDMQGRDHGGQNKVVDPETEFLHAVAYEIRKTVEDPLNGRPAKSVENENVAPELAYLSSVQRDLESLLTSRINETGKATESEKTGLAPELAAIAEYAFGPEVEYLGAVARDMKRSFLNDMGPEIGFLTYAILGPTPSMVENQSEDHSPPSKGSSGTPKKQSRPSKKDAVHKQTSVGQTSHQADETPSDPVPKETINAAIVAGDMSEETELVAVDSGGDFPCPERLLEPGASQERFSESATVLKSGVSFSREIVTEATEGGGDDGAPETELIAVDSGGDFPYEAVYSKKEEKSDEVVVDDEASPVAPTSEIVSPVENTEPKECVTSIDSVVDESKDKTDSTSMVQEKTLKNQGSFFSFFWGSNEEASVSPETPQEVDAEDKKVDTVCERVDKTEADRNALAEEPEQKITTERVTETQEQEKSRGLYLCDTHCNSTAVGDVEVEVEKADEPKAEDPIMKMREDANVKYEYFGSKDRKEVQKSVGNKSSQLTEKAVEDQSDETRNQEIIDAIIAAVSSAKSEGTDETEKSEEEGEAGAADKGETPVVVHVCN